MPLKHGVWVGYILINTTNPNPIPDPNHRTDGISQLAIMQWRPSTND